MQNGTTKWEPLDSPFTRKTGGEIRNLNADSDTMYSDWRYKISASISDITWSLWGGTALGTDNDPLEFGGIDPL